METVEYRGRYTSAISTFAESDGIPTDAESVTLVLHRPDGTHSSSISPEHLAGSGLYYYTFNAEELDQLGLHRIEWTIVGNASVKGGTHVDTFIVSSV